MHKSHTTTLTEIYISVQDKPIISSNSVFRPNDRRFTP